MQRSYRPFLIRHNFIIEAKWAKSTMGTTKVGSRLKGKKVTALFGWSNASNWNGTSADKTAVFTILRWVMMKCYSNIISLCIRCANWFVRQAFVLNLAVCLLFIIN